MNKNKNIFFEILIPIVFLMIGISIFCYPMFLNLDKMPGDYSDARFINYVLEHGYLWLNNVDIHKNFWDLPIFYPHKNTLAYSDIMLGAMIIYSPIRFFIKNPQAAFQLFYVVVLILNFVSFYFLAKRFKLNCLYSSFAAYFFTFCLVRHAQTIHLQLFWQFYSILSVLCFSIMLNENSKLKKWLLFVGGLRFLFFSFILLFILAGIWFFACLFSWLLVC